MAPPAGRSVHSPLRAPPLASRTSARRGVGSREELPEETVTRFVDGREEVAAHGPREMPLWGDAFRSTGAGGQDEAPHRHLEALRAMVSIFSSTDDSSS